ncbi:MAG: type IV secretion system protein [Pseudomonadota bacterium]
MLGACDGSEAWCVVSDPNAYTSQSKIKNTASTSIAVYADGYNPAVAGSSNQWISSGVSVTQGEIVTLTATGSILVATPYGLSSSTASGDSVSSLVGNPAATTQMEAYDVIFAGGDYTKYYDNGGLGTRVVINANATGPTTIVIPGTTTPFYFVPTQNITVTTSNCGTGDVSGSTPSKWTWGNGWQYNTVRCNFKSHNGSFSLDNSSQCKARKICNRNKHNVDFRSSRYDNWLCNLAALDSASYQSSDDVCPCSQSSVSGCVSGTAANYSCETNQESGKTGLCFSATGWTVDDGYCGSKKRDEIDGIKKGSFSGTSPGCGSDDDTYNYATPQLNLCGITNTCWNIGGYRLYAIQGTQVCPQDATCVHLNKSTIKEGGKSFNAYGGTLKLKIYDPNVAVSQIDVTSLRQQITDNTTQINNLSAANSTLENNLVIQLGAVNNFSGYDCSQVAYLYAIADLFAVNFSTSTYATNFNSLKTYLSSLSGYCNTLVTQLSPNYVQSSSTDTPWTASFSNIQTKLGQISSISSTIGTPLLPENTELSSTDWAEYQLLLNSVVSAMNANINQFTSNTLSSTRVQIANYLTDNSATLPLNTQNAITDLINAMNQLQLQLNNSPNDFNTQISLLYQDPFAENLVEPFPPYWLYFLNNTLPSYITNVTNAVNAVNDIDPSFTYTSAVNSLVSNINAAIVNAKSTNTTISNNSTSISTYSSSNFTLEGQIRAANNSGVSGAVGGYTAYIKADPVIATNGTYLHAVVTGDDPNVAGAQTVDLGGITALASGNTSTMATSGTIWLKIQDPDNNYSNNLGEYTATITQKKETNSFAKVLTDLFKHVSTTVNQAAMSIFMRIGCSDTPNNPVGACNDYLRSIHIVLNLYIIVFGMMFMFGLIKVNYLEFLSRVIKISILIILASENSYTFFSQYLFNTFFNFSQFIIAKTSGAPIDNPFAFLNQSVTLLLFDGDTYLKILALMGQGLIGLPLFILMIYAAFCFIVAIFEGIKVYIMSIIGVGLCLAIAPIFIGFILFEKTQYLFELWMKALLRFTFEPIVLLVGLVLLNQLLLTILQQLFNFGACFKCTFPFSFNIPGVFDYGSAFCLPWFSPWGVDNVGTGIPFIMFMSIPLIISFAIVSSIMKSYAETFSREITSTIFGEGMMFAPQHDTKNPPLTLNPFQGAMDFYTEAPGYIINKAKQIKDDAVFASRAVAGAVKYGFKGPIKLKRKLTRKRRR